MAVCTYPAAVATLGQRYPLTAFNTVSCIFAIAVYLMGMILLTDSANPGSLSHRALCQWLAESSRANSQGQHSSKQHLALFGPGSLCSDKETPCLWRCRWPGKWDLTNSALHDALQVSMKEQLVRALGKTLSNTWCALMLICV